MLLSSSGAVGSGLCVFSRYPIAAAYTHQFSVTGGMHKLFDGEILAGKAITGYKIQTPGGQIAFFNTHVSLGISLIISRPLPSCSSLATSEEKLRPGNEATRRYF